MQKQGISVPALPRPRVFVAYIGDDARDEAVKLAAQLRRSGLGVIEAIGSRSLKAQLRQANTLGAHYTLIIGEQEVKTGTAILRDMTSARQETIPLTQLQQQLQQLAV